MARFSRVTLQTNTPGLLWVGGIGIYTGPMRPTVQLLADVNWFDVRVLNTRDYDAYGQKRVTKMASADILNRIYAAVDYISNLEGQDTNLVLEMSQAMINDLINDGDIKPMIEYVNRYCDVSDSPEMTQEIADDI